MMPASFLPCSIAVILLASFNSFARGAELFPWGIQNGDTAAWVEREPSSHYTIDLEKPFNFNGVMRDQITVRIHKAIHYNRLVK